MRILGSSFTAVMDSLEPKLRGIAVLIPFEGARPLDEQLKDVDGLILGMHRVDEGLMRGNPRLKLLHQHGRGLDGVDLDAAARLGVTVLNVPGGNSVAVAELALALVLQLAKGLNRCAASIGDRMLGIPVGIELAGKTMLIVGLGSAGAELARRAMAFGMRVEATRANPSAPSPVGVVVHGPGALDDALTRADVVVLTATLTAATQGMIGRAQLARLKRSAILVNVARAGLIVREALLESLSEGRLHAAGTDVFWQEPADPRDPLLQLPNFVLTPHVAGFTDVSIDHVTDVIAANVREFARGRPRAV